MRKPIRSGLRFFLFLLLFCASAFAQQAEVSYNDDFQSYGSPRNPPGWVDTSIGSSKPIAGGLYKTWPDPTQGNKGSNIVFGTKQSSGKPEHTTNPRIGTFSTLSTKSFSGQGRFEYRGRLIRTSADSRIGLTFFSSYPEQDKYYLLGLWSQSASSPKLTMQLFAFGAGTLTKTVDSNFTPEPNKWYRFAIQVDDKGGETQIRARFWLDGATEPTTYSIDAADAGAARLTSGRIGVWAAVKGDAYIDDLFAKSPVDYTPPVLTLWESGTQLDPAITTAIAHPAQVEGRATDDLSGVAKITLTMDGAAYVANTPVPVEGTHEFKGDVTDVVGNKSSVSAKVLVDLTKPVVTLLEKGQPLATRSFNYAPAIDFTATDNLTGIKSLVATLNGQPYTAKTPITREGVNYLQVVAVDGVGHTTTVTESLLVDLGMPVIQFFESKNPITSPATFTFLPTIEFEVKDAVSTPTFTAALDGTPGFTSPTKITALGWHTLVVDAKDSTGNTSQATLRFLVDTDKPVIVLTEDGKVLDPSKPLILNHIAKIGIEVTDVTSKPTWTSLLDGAAYTSLAPISAEKTHTLVVDAKDEAGNTASVTLTVIVDMTAPRIEFREANIPLDPAVLQKFAHDANLTLVITDAQTSAPTYTATLDATTDVRSPFTVVTETTHVLVVTAKDDAGNPATAKLDFIVDKTKPVVKLTELGTATEVAKELTEGVVHRFARDAKVRVDAIDNLGQPQTVVLLDGNTYAGEPISADGPHSITVEAKDSVGNTTNAKVDLLIDQTGPVIDARVDNVPLDAAKRNDFRKIPTVSIEVTDALLPVTFEAKLVERVFRSGDTVKEGYDTLTIEARDDLGNKTTVKFDLLVDTAPPDVTLLANGEPLPESGKFFNENVTITPVIKDVSRTTTTAKLNGVERDLSLLITEERTHTLDVSVEDDIKFVTPKGATFVIDKKPPVITVLEIAGDGPVEVQQGSSFAHSVRFKPTAQDQTLVTYVMTIDGAPYTRESEYVTDGTHVLVVNAEDQAKNRSSVTFTFHIERENPEVTLLEGIATFPAGFAFDRDVVADVRVKAATTWTAEATITNRTTGVTKPYTLKTPFTEEGFFTIKVVVTTAAQRTSTVSADFSIDKVAPTIQLFANGIRFPAKLKFKEDVTITAVHDDNMTKPPHVQITLNDQQILSGAVLTKDDFYTITGTARDDAKHTTVDGPYDFVLDRTPPEVTVWVTDEKELEDGAKFKEPVTLDIRVKDLTPWTLVAKLTKKLETGDVTTDYVSKTQITADARYELRLTATDDLGNVRTLEPFHFVLDQKPPVVLITEDDKPFVDNGRFERVVTPVVSVQDTTDTEIITTVDDKPWSSGQTISAEGPHFLEAVVTDELGWSTVIGPIHFTIDIGAPRITITDAATGIELAPNHYFNRDVRLKVTVTDATPTTSSATLNGGTYVSESLITEEKFGHAITVHAEDAFQHKADVGPVPFTVDKTPPLITITIDGKPLVDKWYADDVTPVITIFDISPLEEVRFTLDGAPYERNTAITAEGEHVLSVYAKDAAKWERATGDLHFSIDKNPPVITVKVGGKDLASGDEFKEIITPAITVTDRSLESETYTLDGEDYVKGTPIGEGKHTLVVTAKDRAGWTATTGPLTFIVDLSPPVITITERDEPFVSGMKFNRPVQPKVKVDDLTKTTTTGTIDGDNWPIDSVISGDGDRKLVVTSTDNLQHTATLPPITFRIDTTPPEVFITANDKPMVSGNAYRDLVKPEITIRDISETVTTATLNDEPFTFGTTITVAGNYVLKVTVVDELGNPTIVPPIAFVVDQRPPTVLVINGDKELVDGLWMNQPVTPDAIVKDDTPTTTVATLNGEKFELGTKLTAEGTYVLVVTATDQVGLSTTVGPLTFTIDTTPPAITIDTPMGRSTVATPRVPVGGNSDDAVSVEVNGVEATLDPATKKYTLPSLELLEGENTISALGIDRAGNNNTVSITVTLDTRAPELAVVHPAANACLSAPQLEVRGTLSEAGATTVRVRAGDGAPVNAVVTGLTWTATVPLPGEGQVLIRAEASDANGHTSNVTFPVTVDRTKPVIEVTEGGSPFAATLVNRAVAFIVRAKDADAKAVLTLTLDGAAYENGTAITGEGRHVLKASAKDCAGNTSDEKVLEFVIDRIPPALVTVNPANGSKHGTKPASIGGTLSELASLVVEGTQHAAVVNGTSFTLDVPLGEGTNQLGFLLTDLAGNQARVLYTLTLKTTTPTVEIVEDGSPLVARYNRPVTPEIRSNEKSATITATHNGQPFTSGTAISDNGSHTITAFARDEYGHQSETATATFTIDRTAPTVDITEPADEQRIAASTVVVRGTWGGATRVTVNGIVATLDGGRFSASVPLDLGSTVLLATAADDAGNTASDQVEVFREDASLALILTSPPDKLFTNRPTTIVAGQIITPSEAASLTVNGAAMPFDAAGAFERVDFPLVEGPNVITATVTKKVGGQSSVTVQVLADFTPPVLKVLANNLELMEGAQFDASPSLTLEATDNIPEGLTTKLLVDGVVWTHHVLENGGHSVTATARDAAGNEARVDRTFFVGTGASSCSITSVEPADGSAVYNESIKVGGRTTAPKVLINGAPAYMSGGSFAAPVTLVPGANEFSLRCASADGIAFGEPVKLTLHRILDPTITITTPVNDEQIKTNKVTVTGTVGTGVISGDVNGVTFTPVNGTYTVPDVPLTAGMNVIAARAKTASGRAAVATVRVLRVDGAPQIAINTPLPGTQTGANQVDVSGTYVNVVPSTLTVTAGSATLTPQVHAQSATTGTFIVPSASIAAGSKTTITVAGRNAANAQASASTDVTQVTKGPSIVISTPDDNTYVASTVTTLRVTGTFIAPEGSQVSVNGVQATVTGSSFTADVELSVASGTNVPVIARVTVPDGRGATDAIRVVRFSKALEVVDHFPAANAVEVDPAVLLVTLFSNALEASTVNGGVTLRNTANAEVGFETYVDRDAISIAPHQPLARGEHYTLTIGTSVKDLSGASLAKPFTLGFTVAYTAPATPPVLETLDAEGCFTTREIKGTASVPGARVRLEMDGVTMTTTSHATTGAFSFTVSFGGQPGYHIARIRQLGSDGTLSPEKAVCTIVNCAAPSVVEADLDRAGKTLTIRFSKKMDAATLVANAAGSLVIVPDGDTALTGTVTTNAANDTATVALTTVPEKLITLTVRTTAKDATGTPLAAEYIELFTLDGEAFGKGLVSGAVYDATTGRPLAMARVDITGQPTIVTSERGRYARPVAEGAYTIRASAPGYTTVWRQVVVPVGSGVVPIDIRLTRRGAAQTADGTARTLTHLAETAVTKKTALALTASSLPNGKKVRVTSVGAQSLAGLLPLGWSPLAAAEIVVDDATEPQPLPGAKLTFTIKAAQVTAANQALALAQYDDERDEWQVVNAAPVVADDITFDVLRSGNYALVYPDKATHLAAPPAARAGATLLGVTSPCTAAPADCTLVRKDFTLDPGTVLPNGRTVATLITEGAAQKYPSGTAVQAFIDERLNLTDGTVLYDPPFATDLLLYRDLAGTTGLADFHLAPTPRAAAVLLRDGIDHIRVVEYPGRIDRGTLVGADGGRVPGDDLVSLDIPANATLLPLHASVTSLSAQALARFGSVAGFRIAGGFTFTLTRDSEPEPVEGVTFRNPELVKPARATFSVAATALATPSSQVLVAEVLGTSPYGVMLRLAGIATEVSAGRYTTRVIEPAQLPLDGIVRGGEYVILAAENPIAFAFGRVQLAAGAAVPNAKVTAGTGKPAASLLGVTDLTRTGGTFVVPVASQPALPFSLTPRTVALGEGTPAVAASSPAAGAFVDFGVLALDAVEPVLESLTPNGKSLVDSGQAFVVTARFSLPIELNSATSGIVVRNLARNMVVEGSVAVSGRDVTWTPAVSLEAGTRYSITLLPGIRSTNGAAFGRTVITQFETYAIPPGNGDVKPSLIRVSMPDENGKSIVKGLAGALPRGALAVVVRRNRTFIRDYTLVIDRADGSFELEVGNKDARDRITIADELELQVLHAISKSIIAVVPLTPFVSADGRAVVAMPNKEVHLVTPEGYGVVIAAGTFDKATIVRLTPVTRDLLNGVPGVDEMLVIGTGVKVEFEGKANKPLELELPAGPATNPNKHYILGQLGQSIRGPRIFAVDVLRLNDGKLTTEGAEESAAGARFQARTLAEPGVGSGVGGGVLVGKQALKYLYEVQQAAAYFSMWSPDNPDTQLLWFVVDLFVGGASDAARFADIFNSVALSFYLPDFYIIEFGRVLMPGIAGKPFSIYGVDSATGLQTFTKTYEGGTIGGAGDIVQIESPVADEQGPYPIFASPFRVDAIDALVDEARTGPYLVKFEGGIVSVKDSGSEVVDKLLPKTPVQLFNARTGELSSTVETTTSSTLPPIYMAAERGDRIFIIAGAVDASPDAEIAVVFNEAIKLPSDETGGTADDDADFLAGAITLEQLEPWPNELSTQVTYKVDSGGRRVILTLPAPLVRGGKYRVTLTTSIVDRSDNPLGLGTGPSGTSPIKLDFTVRKSGADVNEFKMIPAPEHQSAQLRDLARYGNLAFVAAQDGGLLAYDMSDPSALQGVSTIQPSPISYVPAKWQGKALGLDEHWSVATDIHGRVYSAGYFSMYSTLRIYNVEDFVAARDATTRCPEFPDLSPQTVCKFHGNVIVGWRPGAGVQMSPVSNVLISDRPEATPRRIQVVTQDDAIKYETLEEFKAAETEMDVVEYNDVDGFEKFDVVINYAASAEDYAVQRVTIVNETLKMRWSGDIVANKPDQRVKGVIARPTDKLTVIRNVRTYALVTLFGYGLGLYDITAVQSNDTPVKPAGYEPKQEQVLITDGEPPPTQSNSPIKNITYTPEVTTVPGADSSVIPTFVVDATRGLLGMDMSMDEDGGTYARGYGLIFKDKPAGYIHPRLASVEPAVIASGGRLTPRFSGLAYHRGSELDPDHDYILVSGGSYGVLVVTANGGTDDVDINVGENSLVGMIWIPAGAYNVRKIPDTNLALVIDGKGRVLLVDVSHVDESADVTSPNELFPIAKKAMTQFGIMGETGVDDPRIIWKSEPDFVFGTLPPLFDPSTGTIFGGHINTNDLKVTTAFDPVIRMKANVDAEGLTYVGGVVPLGIAPPDEFKTKIEQDTTEAASMAAFRLEVTLPAGLARALETAGRKVALAIESEGVPGATTPQTPAGLPRSHLRTKTRGGANDSRATQLELRRVMPRAGTAAENEALEKALRHQEGFNSYVSPWIVAIADPRASDRYTWTYPSGVTSDSQKSEYRKKQGCPFCERPKPLRDKTETEGVYELWTNGRFISIRADGSLTDNVFTGTPYAHLGLQGRMSARFATIMADTVRPDPLRVAAQNAPVAEGMLDETTYLHSGEVESDEVDLEIEGRGVDVQVARTYRSRTIGGTLLGLGWDSTLFRRLRALPSGDLEYRDGDGEVWLFQKSGSTDAADAAEARAGARARYVSPKGLALKVVRTDRGWTMFDQQWRITEFDELGRLIAESDEFLDPTDSTAGNTNRYVYDETGRVATIVDPFNRRTHLKYWADDAAAAGSYPGLLRQVSDWRTRLVDYEYDAQGRLTKVKTPVVRAGTDVPGTYSYENNSRPAVEYTYQSVSTPGPTQPNTDFVDFASNLLTIKDPANTAPRVRFQYFANTNPVERDRVEKQFWPCGNYVATACGETTAKFLYSENSSTGIQTVEVTDMLQQVRTYVLTSVEDNDERVHIDTATVKAPTFVAGGTPNPLLATFGDETLVTDYGYDGHGQLASVLHPNGLNVTTEYDAAPNGAPGQIIKMVTETPAGVGAVPLVTEYKYDNGGTAATPPTLSATVQRIGRRGEGDPAFVYRDAQSPSRDLKKTQERDTGITHSQTFDKRGQLSTIETTKLASGGTVTQKTAVTYYENPLSSPAIALGRPWTIIGGDATDGTSIKFTYSELPGGGEQELAEDLIRGTKTYTDRDSEGRVTRISVEKGSDVLTAQHFGFDSSGNTLYEDTAQTGVSGDKVITTRTFDARGRLASTSVTNAHILGSFTDVRTAAEYNLNERTLTEVLPHTSPSDAAKKVTTLDGLGRPELIELHPGTGGGSLVRRRMAYDKSGELSFESDSVVAAAHLYDDFGREKIEYRADGTRTESKWTGWDELREETDFAANGDVVAHTYNTWSDNGRLRRTADEITSTGESRVTQHTWDDGETNETTRVGKIASVNGDLSPLEPVRVIQRVLDAAGRVKTEKYGLGQGPGTDTSASGALLDPGDVFLQVDREYLGELPTSETRSEPRAGRSVSSITTYDDLGRLRERIEAGRVETMEYDEQGNLTLHSAPGSLETRSFYDSRGLAYRQDLPGPGAIELQYDEYGNLRRHVDEDGEVTTYTVDGLGRVTDITYPDLLHDLIEYEPLTGRVAAVRDRAGQWQSFKYDGAGRVIEIHSAQTTTAIETKFTYEGGRLVRVANRTAAIEYDDFDRLGRPRKTRSIRYRDNSGLAGMDVLDVHTQEHRWTVFDGERSRWRMPAAGNGVPSGDSASPWLAWIDETRDAASNLTGITEELSGSAAPSGPALYQAIGRGITRLAQRTLFVGAAGQLRTEYGYADGPGVSGPASIPTSPSSPGDADGSLGRAQTIFGARVLAGSEVTRDDARRIEDVTDRGLADRHSRYGYDANGRLQTSVLNKLAGTTADPFAGAGVSNGGFVGDRPISGRTASSDAIQTAAPGQLPLSWSAGRNPGKKINEKRTFISDPAVAVDVDGYSFTGQRRTLSGDWTVEYDTHSRVTSVHSAALGRRIDYVYDPMNRVVGRLARQLDASGAWSLETRTNVLARDGLPAHTTWVWDPITDRLVSIFEAEKSVNGTPASTTAAEAGLVRQYLHGDSDYDDPIAVLVAGPDGTVLRRLPITDEAATDSLQAVVDENGALVERVLYADAYGDAPRFLRGPAVDRIAVRAASGNREVRVHVSEEVVATTIANGARLYALADETRLRELAPTSLEEGSTLVWTLDPAEWAGFVAGATNIEVALTPSLQAEGWGTTPPAAAPRWAQLLNNWQPSAGSSFASQHSIALLDTTFASADASSDEGAALFEITDLYLAGELTSSTKLNFDFQKLPFREPATGMVYARERWYDASTASFLTPDPEGYADSSNLYAFVNGDPINSRDPDGRSLRSAWNKLLRYGGSSGRAAAKGVRAIDNIVDHADDIAKVNRALRKAPGLGTARVAVKGVTSSRALRASGKTAAKRLRARPNLFLRTAQKLRKSTIVQRGRALYNVPKAAGDARQVIPNVDKVGDALQAAATRWAKKWNPAEHLSDAERAAIRAARQHPRRKHYLPRLLERQAKGRWVERRVSEEFQHLTWSSRGVDVRGPGGMSYDLLLRSKWNITRHARRMPDELFRFIVFD
ncbi:MAG TPA: Ig-like domain-containing protein [Thermoanaerobaculia bacterium]